MSLLNLLFPKTCVGCGKVGAYFCAKCIPALPLTFPICPLCRKGSVGGVTHDQCRRLYGLDGLVSIFSYEAGIKEAVKRLKYRFVRDLAEGFVEIAMWQIDPSVVAFFKRKHFTVCPIPLSRARERWRGFNQASLLGEILARRMGLELMPLLQRVKDTQALAELRVWLSHEELQDLSKRYLSKTQKAMAEKRLLSEKKAKMRREQMQGAFRLNSTHSTSSGQEFEVKNLKLLVVDDVWTSGATLGECTKVLKRNGVSLVWGFVFARSGRPF